MPDDPEPTLKCVIAWSPRRNLCTIIADRLATFAPPDDILALGDDAHIVSTPLTTDELRDKLRDTIEPDEALIVLNFETWSGYGQSLDTTWLLAHGH